MSDRDKRLRDGWRARWVAKRGTGGEASSRPYGERFDAIVAAGFPPDYADLYCRTPPTPKHPNAREVRAAIARRKGAQRHERNKARLEPWVLAFTRPYTAVMKSWREEMRDSPVPHERVMALWMASALQEPPAWLRR